MFFFFIFTFLYCAMLLFETEKGLQSNKAQSLQMELFSISVHSVPELPETLQTLS